MPLRRRYRKKEGMHRKEEVRYDVTWKDGRFSSEFFPALASGVFPSSFRSSIFGVLWRDAGSPFENIIIIIGNRRKTGRGIPRPVSFFLFRGGFSFPFCRPEKANEGDTS